MNLQESNNMNNLGTMFIIDCETSGLMPNSLLLSVGGLAINNDLEVIDTFEIILHHKEENLIKYCDEVVQQMHKASGLWNKVIESKVSTKTAKHSFVKFINQNHTTRTYKDDDKEKIVKPILANNTVRMDYMWLQNNFGPTFTDLFDYRTIDVSSLNELCKRWLPSINTKVKDIKKKNHTSLDDAYDTLAELKIYKELLFKGSRK